jgi:hypothetical protein
VETEDLCVDHDTMFADGVKLDQLEEASIRCRKVDPGVFFASGASGFYD